MSDMHDIEMNKETFWNLITAAKDKCGQDHAEYAKWVKEQLLFMGADQALKFNDLMYAYVRHAEQYGLWTAAEIMLGGCSDDSFHYFCAWLVSQGKETYTAALADPDSLADIDVNGDCRFERLNYVGAYAYKELTGKDAYDLFNMETYKEMMSAIRSEIPLGDGIGYPYSGHEAAAYLPKLCAKYDVTGIGAWNYDSPDIKKALKTARKSKRVKNRGDAR